MSILSLAPWLLIGGAIGIVAARLATKLERKLNERWMEKHGRRRKQ